MQFLKLTATAVFACILALPAFAQSPANDPERIAAARDLMEVTGVTRQMDGMIGAMTEGFKRGMKADSSDAGKKISDEFEASMKKFLSYKEEMLRDFAALYAENFSADEMKQVADFYRSGTGAKFIQMTPVLMQKGAQIGLKYSERMMSEMGKAAAPADPK
jgi:hypothetical protein